MRQHNRTAFRRRDRRHNYYEEAHSQSLNWKGMVSHAISILPLDFFKPPLHPDFERAMALLPEAYSSADDKRVYRDFIDGFGTHFVDEAFLGGSQIGQTFFSSCFLFECKGEPVSLSYPHSKGHPFLSSKSCCI